MASKSSYPAYVCDQWDLAWGKKGGKGLKQYCYIISKTYAIKEKLAFIVTHIRGGAINKLNLLFPLLDMDIHIFPFVAWPIFALENK
jgi:hypothetical protein